LSKSVTIIGGGFAGLAAGVYLAEKGFKVDLFEKRPLLGGRAYSVKDSTTGDILDNGQHLLMGCYHHTFAFLKKIGTYSLLEFQGKMEVHFADPHGELYSLRCPSWPSPLHLLGGLLRLQTLDWGEKWALLKFMAGVKKLSEKEFTSLDAITCEQWLHLWHQSEESIQNFWEPLILATLNETPQISSAQMLAVVIREALLKTSQDSQMVLSKVGLSELYTPAAQNFIETRGGKIHLHRGIQKIITSSLSTSLKSGRKEGEYVVKIILEDGSEHCSDFYLSSCPPEALLPLLEEEWKNKNFFKRFEELNHSPILGLNLWFDRPITDKTFVGLINSPVHWVFNKRKIFGERALEDRVRPAYLSLVISGAHDLKNIPNEALLKLALEELGKAFPESKNAKLLHHRIMKELKATPSFGIHSLKLRPSHETPIQNFFLAGDWTHTGLPATIEGAVKSGFEAATMIAQRNI